AAADRFGDEVWFGCAYLEDRPIACGCGFQWGGEFEMTWASALLEYRSTAANMLLYWRFMERAVESGLGLFNFGRCTPDSGTHRFKRQWGTRDETLWWYQLTTGDVDATPSPEDEAFAWGPKVWRHVPLGVANLLGPWIVRYIP
ncbi:MAG TPA: GNAT family N-acetyltransferase, partial [Gemmatimonadota bacterium]|nr:GNAT family N-acetyltransferase [Gemmatimonadota bacterium]